MIPKQPKTFDDLARLCSIFNEIDLFLWLQRKFPPGNMIEQIAANSMRERTIEYITDGLNNVSTVFVVLPWQIDLQTLISVVLSYASFKILS